MRTILCRLGVMLSLVALGQLASAQPTRPELLNLSTCLDTADLTRPVVVPQAQAPALPPRYNYRAAH